MSELPPRPSPPRSARESARAWIEWFGLTRLTATAVAVVVVVGGAWLLVRTPPPAVEATLPVTSGAAPVSTLAVPTTTAAIGASTFVVHVAGAVAAPGVYDVRAPARVVDAIDAAGGPSPQAELDSLNLASPLVDGQRIYVPVVGEIVPPVADGPAVTSEVVERTDRSEHRERGRARGTARRRAGDGHGDRRAPRRARSVRLGRRSPPMSAASGRPNSTRSATSCGYDRANRPSDAQYSDSPRIAVAATNAPAAPIATPTNIHAYSRQKSRHVAIGERVARREATKPISIHSGALATTANG